MLGGWLSNHRCHGHRSSGCSRNGGRRWGRDGESGRISGGGCSEGVEAKGTEVVDMAETVEATGLVVAERAVADMAEVV